MSFHQHIRDKNVMVDPTILTKQIKSHKDVYSVIYNRNTRSELSRKRNFLITQMNDSNMQRKWCVNVNLLESFSKLFTSIN